MGAGRPLNFIDLFCGCGGFSNGFELAGHKCLLGVDFNSDAIETFKLNHKHAATYCGDISQLSANELRKLLKDRPIDLVIGGPPCQGFSTVGKGQADDLRNVLFEQFVRIVRLTRPEFILFENVPGLLAKKNRKVLEKIFKKFTTLGYELHAEIMKAEEFGVPSTRRRTLIAGSLNFKAESMFPGRNQKQSQKRSQSKIATVGETLKKITARKKLENHELDKAQIVSQIDRRRLQRIPEGKGIRYPEDEKKYLTKALSLGIDWEKKPEGRLRQTRFYRLAQNKPAPTIMTGRTSYYHPVEPRYFTVREMAAFQSFPLNFKFKGAVTSQHRQVGNAVPPLLAKAFGKVLLNFQNLELRHPIGPSDKRSARSKKSGSHKKKSSHVSEMINTRAAFHYKKPANKRKSQEEQSIN